MATGSVKRAPAVLPSIIEALKAEKHIYNDISSPEAFLAAVNLPDLYERQVSQISVRLASNATTYIPSRGYKSSSVSFVVPDNIIGEPRILAYSTFFSHVSIGTSNIFPEGTYILYACKYNLGTTSVSLSSTSKVISVAYSVPVRWESDAFSWARSYDNTSIKIYGDGTSFIGGPVFSSGPIFWQTTPFSYADIDSRITTIGTYAFDFCSNLQEVNMPGCIYISLFAFKYCKSLVSINAPSCAHIGQEAFQGCNSLENVNFPSCETVASGAFGYCNSLSSVNLPVCTEIWSTAFVKCSKLATVSFPSLSLIGYGAFMSCDVLTAASFPACTRISGQAFASSPCLVSLYFLGSSYITISSSTFSNTTFSTSSYTGEFGSIYVPASMLDTYKNMNYWSQYSDRLVGV